MITTGYLHVSRTEGYAAISSTEWLMASPYFTIATEAMLLATSSTSRQTCDRHLALRLWLLLYILGGPDLFFDFHEHLVCLHDEFDAVLGCTAVSSFLATS